MQLSISLLGKKWVFIPHRWLTLLVLLFLPLLLGLAYWQWQRGLYKQSMLDAFAIRQSILDFTGQAALPLPAYQAIQVQGQFKPDSIFYLDNQMYAGQAGYQVLIPFELNPSKEWLLINLGWLARHAQRTQLPPVPPITPATTQITGRSYSPRQKFLLLGPHLEKIQANKIIIQTLDLQKLEQFLHHDLLPLILLQDKDPNTPFVRDWQPPSTLPPAKHYGYALQWLLLACTLVILYLTFCTHQEKI